MSDNYTRGHKDVPMPDRDGLDARGNDVDPAAEMDLHVAVDDFTRSLTLSEPAAVLDRLRRVPVDDAMAGGARSAGHQGGSLPALKSGPRLRSHGECMLELNAQLVGSVSGGKTFLAALLQTLAARPVADDAQVWLVDACSGNDARTDTFTLQQALNALNDHYTLPNRAAHAASPCRHRLDQRDTQAVDDQPKCLWISTEHNSNWRSACLPAGRSGQDLDILTEIIAYARPFTGRTFADDVRWTLSTLRAELSRSSRLTQRETPWVRFLDFTWPAPVVGRSLADLLQHQAPEAAAAWRLWSRDHNIALNGHMAGVWRHTVPRHDVTNSAVFVLLSADACRTLTVPPPAAQHPPRRPDVELWRPQPSEPNDLRPSIDSDRARTADSGEDPATGGRTTAESDTSLDLSQHIDDFLTPITIRGRAGREPWGGRERRRVDPPGTQEAIAPVLDADTVRAIKAYEPGEDTLRDIERLLLSAAS